MARVREHCEALEGELNKSGKTKFFKGHVLKVVCNKNLLKRDMPAAFSNLTREKWVELLSSPKVNSKVPLEIHELFEVVRGSMIYGWFFYPLGTLASEQCFRILELATRKRCEALGISLTEVNKSGKTRNRVFAEFIKDLKDRGEIEAKDAERWEGIRALRNAVSHPKGKMLLLPSDQISILTIAAECLNKLFK